MPRVKFPQGFVSREGNRLIIKKLDHSKAASAFIVAIKEGIKKGYSDFIIDIATSQAFFPNALVPIAGTIDCFKSDGISFSLNRCSSAIDQTNFISPEVFQPENPYVMNRVWRFNSSAQVASLVAAFIADLRKSSVFKIGVLESIEWSINEVMDNVLQHANVNTGFVMGQLHSTSSVVAFTVFDYGQGMYNSLRESEHHPKNSVDAITISIQEAVTRDKSIGQGNGLFGLHSIVKQGDGRLAITSGGGVYILNRGNASTFEHHHIISPTHPATTVDFQLNYSSDVSLENVLVFRGIPYKMTNLWLENLEDDLGRIVYPVKDNAEGTGTRKSAERVRNEILNILQESPKTIILDFTGVAVISSSFADELIAKLLLELGLYQFNQVIQLKGLDFTQQNILHRSVVQRMIEEFSGRINYESDEEC